MLDYCVGEEAPLQTKEQGFRPSHRCFCRNEFPAAPFFLIKTRAKV